MESLLANYGSDDEGDEKSQRQHPPSPPLPRTSSRASLFASLPPPTKLFPDGHDTNYAPRSLFASLPRPKFASEDPDEISYGTPINKGTAFGGLEINPAGKDTPVPVPQSGKRVSLFSALPQPKSTDSSFFASVVPATQSGSSKRVVEIRPAINMALLHDDDADGEDDLQPQAKRLATGSVCSAKASGLAAILPKPKNSGSALGSGIASGHHGTLDLGAIANPPPTRTELVSHEASTQLVPCHHSSQHGCQNHFVGEDPGQNAAGNCGDTSTRACEGYNNDAGANVQKGADTVPSSASCCFLPYDHGEDPLAGNYYGLPEDEIPRDLAHDAGSYQSQSNAADPLAHMLMKERKKGAKPLNVIEVKQVDLTATKLREDQLRSTGIAFGPGYKPPSSNKPSKLHRRKHQIGSLYYDMKQKEMELAERRSKGYMTKSVTQAKYGW